MNESTPLSLKYILGFSLAGFCFSGYLTFYKLISGTCAFNETCPIIWGHPACWYGFALYVTLLALSFLTFKNHISLRPGLFAISSISFLGILFAGYLTLGELPALIARGFGAYTFGLPTCFLGLIFFILIFISTLVGLVHSK